MVWVLFSALAAGVALDERLVAASFFLAASYAWYARAGAVVRIATVGLVAAFAAHGGVSRHAAEWRIQQFRAGVARGDTLELSGWVCGYPRPGPGRTTFEFDTHVRGTRHRVLVHAQVFGVAYGDSLRIVARRSRRAAERRRHWLGMGIDGVLYATEGGVERLGGRAGSALLRNVFWPAHDRIRITLNRGLGARDGIPRALLLGEKGGLDPGTRTRFVDLGVSHLFALSGLHLGFVSLMLFMALRVLRLDAYRWICPLLAAYVLTVGPVLSLWRAFLMAVCLVTARALQRRLSLLGALRNAAFLMLAARPLSLYAVGLQLSLLATGIVVSTVAWLPARRYGTIAGRTGSWVRSTLLISVTVQAGLVPILVHYFERVSVAGPIATLLLGPPVSVLLLLASAAVALCTMLPGAGSVVWPCLYLATSAFEEALSWLAGVAPVPIRPPMPVPAVFYAGVALVLWGDRKRWWRWCAGITLLLLSFWLRSLT